MIANIVIFTLQDGTKCMVIYEKDMKNEIDRGGLDIHTQTTTSEFNGTYRLILILIKCIYT